MRALGALFGISAAFTLLGYFSGLPYYKVALQCFVCCFLLFCHFVSFLTCCARLFYFENKTAIFKNLL